MLSADIFKRYIATCLKLYGLDPCNYFSFPGLSWDAMFKMSGVKFKKYQALTDTYLLKKD